MPAASRDLTGGHAVAAKGFVAAAAAIVADINRELSSIRDPRNWPRAALRPAAAVVIGVGAGAGLVVLRTRRRRAEALVEAEIEAELDAEAEAEAEAR